MPNLTSSEYERLRNLVRRSPAFTGMRVVAHNDYVEVLEPHELEISLRPFAERVAGASRDRWPELVDGLLESFLHSLIHGDPELDGPTDALIGRIFPRLKEGDEIPGELSYAARVAPDLYLLFGADQPNQIAILNDKQVERHGFDRLYDAAVDNVFGQLPETVASSEDVYILEGSDYVATLVLVVPWVLEAVTGSSDYPHGVLVAMPNHTRLILHVLRDAEGARRALSEIAGLADTYHAEDNVPLSRRVYWLSPEGGPLDLVAEHAGDGHGVIGEDVVRFYSADFAAALDELDRARG